jgi:hypothetical protein
MFNAPSEIVLAILGALAKKQKPGQVSQVSQVTNTLKLIHGKDIRSIYCIAYTIHAIYRLATQCNMTLYQEKFQMT